ncbi:MAG TPA: hypothetical protein VGO40_16620 [Longimicrobium sp.]|jgi:hypothetical protein|nr:hypothetical protein [Longimicrobium sp.]
MRIHIAGLLAAGLALAASPAAAQHCWPTSIALVVRDAAGAVVDPRPLMDSVQYSPRRREPADFMVRVALIHPNDTNSFDRPGGIPAITWYRQGDCRVDVREVVLRRGPVVMRLWMDLHLDSQARPGSSDFLLKSPPFAPGTWRLDVCRLPQGKMHAYAPIPTRWVRVSASGDPGTPWQPPQGCGTAG